tara:strand:+ start:313 stop:684 length:372 start_codon:yes stop_codon:yes gene_type:complete
MSRDLLKDLDREHFFDYLREKNLLNMWEGAIEEEAIPFSEDGIECSKWIDETLKEYKEQFPVTNTLTNKQLIEQLQRFDGDKPVNISAVGFNTTDSWDAPLQLEEDTVDEHNNIIRINFSLYG